jgi:hypothetical protein
VLERITGKVKPPMTSKARDLQVVPAAAEA